MDSTENHRFSSCEEDLCFEPDQMSDHSQYPDDLIEESYQTTGDNIDDMYSQDDNPENTDEDDIDDVKESRSNDQLNEDFSAEDDSSKGVKTERCMCEIADDKNGDEDNTLECKTHNENKDVNPDNHPVKLNNQTAEFDKSVLNEDASNYDTSMKYLIEGGKITTVPEIYPHSINSDLDRFQNGESFVIYRMFYIPKLSKKEEPEYEIENMPYAGIYELEVPYRPRGLLERRTRSMSPGHRITLQRERQTRSELLTDQLPPQEHHARLPQPLKYRTPSIPRYRSGDTPKHIRLPVRSPENRFFIEGKSGVKLSSLPQQPGIKGRVYKKDASVSDMSISGTSFLGFEVEPISEPEAKSKFKSLFRKWDPVFYNVELPPFKQELIVSEMPEINQQIFK